MTDPQAAKDLNRVQFGANSANYASSVVHAAGASLERLVELVEPRPHWRALDVATAAGHTAFAFAPHVAEIVASDLTPEMVALAERRAADLAMANVTTRLADAEDLPFDDSTFDLVTCRIAPHHFPNPRAFVREMVRVLRPGGVVGFVDNVVPENSTVARAYNDWERERDPSHVRALSMGEWTELFESAGLTIAHSEVTAKRMSFANWCDNMNVAATRRPDLLERLFDPATGLPDFLEPAGSTEADATFALAEGLIVAASGTT